MKILMRSMLAVLAMTATLFAAAQTATPERALRMVVPYPPGSGTDTIARYTARRLETALARPVVVENRTGGNAIIAVQSVIAAPADGNTLLWAANGPVTTNVALYEKLPYDPTHDLVPVARTAYSPMGLFVPAGSPFTSAKALLDDTRNRPGKLNYGSGSATYSIASEWLLSLAGGTATGVQYKGAAPAMQGLAGGEVDFVIAEYSAAMPLLQAGKVRVLAVTAERRMPSQPEVPTLQELGYKDFFQVAWWGVFVARGTAPATVAALEKALLDIYGDAESRTWLDQRNFSTFIGDSNTLRAFQAAEIEREVRLVNAFRIPKM